jgi:hypothetical protein
LLIASRNTYFAVQVAMLTATLLIAIYVAFWLFGGINLHVSTLFFSQQANDTQSGFWIQQCDQSV